MIKKTLTVVSFALIAVSCFGDFIADYKKAEKLFNSGRNKEAAAQFGALASKAAKDSKDECLFMQAWALGKIRQYDNALKAISLIQAPMMKQCADFFATYYCKSPNELLRKYGKTDFTKFPEEYRHFAFIFRAERTMNTAQANADFQQGLKFAGRDVIRKLQALSGLTRTYASLGKKAEAKQAAAQAISIKGYSGLYYTICAALVKARIEVDEKNFAAAEKTLNSIKLNNYFAKASQGLDYYELRGDIALSKGQKAEAKKAYETALGNKHIWQKRSNDLKKKLASVK